MNDRFKEGYFKALEDVRYSVLSIEKEAKHCDSDGYFGYLEAFSNVYAKIDKLIKDNK